MVIFSNIVILIIYSLVENRLDINRKYTKNYLLISRITAILIFTSSYILTNCSSAKVDYLGNIGYFIPVGCLVLYNFVEMGLREIEIKKQEKNKRLLQDLYSINEGVLILMFKISVILIDIF